ncbi:Trypanosomal VSG domain containing protein, putative [Trypanosoma equiperdum]|uniref:Trypanosomal VSG domain containing protein, putative n=1 Tax=Trypanosoma equiperdum TaxID=5694 RepID=A0A1G4IBJ2_TRYEQ|nr:Trypanosomal VSG domain containing protein, putative [Trypanosoma equiperdum]
MKEIALTFLLAAFGAFRLVCGEDSKLVNEKEFNQMCEILRLAEGEPEKIMEEPANLTSIIDRLQMFVKATYVKDSLYKEAMERRKGTVNNSGAAKMSMHRANDIIRWRVTHEKLIKLAEKATILVSGIREERRLANVSRKFALERMAQVVYGANAGRLMEKEEFEKFAVHTGDTLIGNSAEETCGAGYHPSTEDAMAGRSLVGDFFCLCVGEENNETVCHKSIKGPGRKKLWKNVSYDGSDVAFGPGWFKIKDEACPKNENLKLITPEKIQDAVREFNKLLGRQRENIIMNMKESEGFRTYVFGRAKKIHTGVFDRSENICTGKNDQMCVNYAYRLLTQKGIEWQLRLLDAEKYLVEMERHNKEAKVLLGRLWKLAESMKSAAAKINLNLEDLMMESEVNEVEEDGAGFSVALTVLTMMALTAFVA